MPGVQYLMAKVPLEAERKASWGAGSDGRCGWEGHMGSPS